MNTRNLRAEMTREGITQKDLAEGLKLHHQCINNRINNRSEFRVSELIAIRDRFFPDMSLDYLAGTTTNPYEWHKFI